MNREGENLHSQSPSVPNFFSCFNVGHYYSGVKGFRLSRTKTEYMRCDFGTTTREEEDVSLEGQVVPRKDTFRYLGSMLQRDGDVIEPLNLYKIKYGCPR